MSRQETMLAESWRVQIYNCIGEVIDGSIFKDETSASYYYDELNLPGRRAVLEVRRANSSRYVIVSEKEMYPL